MSMFNNNQPYMPGFGFRPQIFQQAGMPQQAPQQSTVTYVTSRAQAEVAQIPFDGMMYFFLNTSTRELYGKAFDLMQSSYSKLSELNSKIEEVNAVLDGYMEEWEELSSKLSE